jgi:adenylate kinase family enzyme
LCPPGPIGATGTPLSSAGVRRVNVIGTSGSGKTTVAAALARRMGVEHVELDALSWGPNWEMVPPEVLRERVRAAAAVDAWVIDGNYSATRDLVWARADTVVWLDMPRRVVMWRVISRTARRLVRREVLWSGNQESLRTAFSRDSIILWAWTTYGRRRRDYPGLFLAHPHLDVVRLRSAAESRRFLAATPPAEPAPTVPRTPAGQEDTPPGAGTRRSGPARQ